VTVLLIALNVAAFLWELGLGRHLQDAFLMWAIVKVKRFYRRRYEDEDMPW